MSDDLISRQAALYELHLLSIEALKKHRFDYDALITICSKKLKNLPSVQPEQKMGEWGYGEFDIPYCSICGHDVMPNMVSPYCPNCGAKMESDNNDN